MDFFIASSFVHHRKPAREIYRMALDLALVAPAQVAYLEDREMFVDVARDLGMHAIHHTSYATTCAALKTLGLAVECGEGE